jgi:hypothetical protein
MSTLRESAKSPLRTFEVRAALLLVTATALVAGTTGALASPVFAAVGLLSGAGGGFDRARLYPSAALGRPWRRAAVCAGALAAPSLTGVGPQAAQLLAEAGNDTLRAFAGLVRGSTGDVLGSYPVTTPVEWLLIAAALLLLASAAWCYDITRLGSGPRPAVCSAVHGEGREPSPEYTSNGEFLLVRWPAHRAGQEVRATTNPRASLLGQP